MLFGLGRYNSSVLLSCWVPGLTTLLTVSECEHRRKEVCSWSCSHMGQCFSMLCRWPLPLVAFKNLPQISQLGPLHSPDVGTLRKEMACPRHIWYVGELRFESVPGPEPFVLSVRKLTNPSAFKLALLWIPGHYHLPVHTSVIWGCTSVSTSSQTFLVLKLLLTLAVREGQLWPLRRTVWYSISVAESGFGTKLF